MNYIYKICSKANLIYSLGNYHDWGVFEKEYFSSGFSSGKVTGTSVLLNAYSHFTSKNFFWKNPRTTWHDLAVMLRLTKKLMRDIISLIKQKRRNINE